MGVSEPEPAMGMSEPGPAVRGAGPAVAAEVIDHTWIPMPDGTRLAARIWLPRDAVAVPVPALLEFLPYRQRDLMAQRDATIYPYFAARGYACARVDIRGTGNSDGVILDEYTPQEQDDACEVIAWLASQPWCDGGVGMLGLSWSGFNSLQVAARRPPALRAILTMGSTDDRYADDVHYRGGCVLATDMLQWAVSMLTWNALPADPAIVGETWRDQWVERIEKSPAFVEAWMSHQLRDDYWRHGSVCEGYGAIEVPVYAVGGWADGYTDAVLRLLGGLGGPRKGLIGPWSHAWPNEGVPGPQIGFLEEALRWWDHWLKGRDTGIMDEPMLRVWMQEHTEPAPHHDDWPGRWVGEPAWPPPEGLGGRMHRLYLDAAGGGRLSQMPGTPTAHGAPAVLTHRGEQAAGLDAGVFIADGGRGDWPGDQRAEDGRSLCFTSARLETPLEILGNARVSLLLTSDQPGANVVVRLCDVTPNGESLLVTRDVFNLTHRQGHDRAVPLVPGEPAPVEMPLKVIAHRFEAGHRVRLSVSTTYWPWMWPHPEPVVLGLICGDGSFVDLPVRLPRPEDASLAPFGPPEHPPGAPIEVLSRRPTTRTITYDLASDSAEVVFDWDVGGNFRLVDVGIEADGSNITIYRIRNGEPLSAEVATEQFASLRFDGVETRIEATGRMTADRTSWLVTLHLDAREQGHRVRARQWNLRIPRLGA